MSATKTIWKFTLRCVDLQTIKLPIGAQMLAVQMQHGMPQLWALVDPADQIEKRAIRIVGTGHPVEFGDSGRYLGTFQLHDGALVFHIFDLGSVL